MHLYYYNVQCTLENEFAIDYLAASNNTLIYSAANIKSDSYAVVCGGGFFFLFEECIIENRKKRTHYYICTI